MSNDVVFRIDLSTGVYPGTLPDSPENIAYNLSQATVYLPNISGTFKHGDTITVSALDSLKFSGIPGVVSVPQVVSPPGNSFTPGGSGSATNTTNAGVYTFNVSDSWTSPSGDKFIEVVCIGGGGGGSYDAGGGGGGSATSTLYVKSNTAFDVMVGGGGPGNPNLATGDGQDAGNGSDGDDSYFRKSTTILVRAKGGKGGTNDGPGGDGGNLSGIGSVMAAGGDGGPSTDVISSGGGGGGAGNDTSGGVGGNIRGGGGGLYPASVSGGNGGDGAYLDIQDGTLVGYPGRNGQIPGGGGGGCDSASEGTPNAINQMGDGANGQVVVAVLPIFTNTYNYTGSTQTFTAPQTGVFVAKLWGGGAGGGPTPLSIPGGGGGGLTAGNSKAGGGGGGYAEKEFTASLGEVYSVTVGGGGLRGVNGGNSILTGTPSVTATGGLTAVGLNGGIGGFGSGGDLIYHGGHGGSVDRVVGASTSFGGGGGGSSGGTLHNGEDGDPFNGNTPGAGGQLIGSDGIGGNGGAGGDNGIAGSVGVVPGGGGGGGGNNANSASGANGRVEIVYPA